MSPFLAVLLGGSAALYTLSAIAHVFYMFRREFDAVAKWATRSAWLIQSIGLVWLIAHTRQAPVYTLFEMTYSFTWFMMTIYLLIELYKDNQAAGSFLLPAIALLQIVGVSLPKPGQELLLNDEFPASLIGWHVGVTMLGYGFFTASFVAAALYLLQERNLRLKRWGPLYYRLPSLETLDIWGGRLVYVGFPLLTIGMSAGLGFAHVTWDTFWQADPKVIFTVLVWLVYGGYLLMRKVWGWGGRRAAWWSVAGVIGILINYFVINLVSTVHRFGV